MDELTQHTQFVKMVRFSLSKSGCGKLLCANI